MMGTAHASLAWPASALSPLRWLQPPAPQTPSCAVSGPHDCAAVLGFRCLHRRRAWCRLRAGRLGRVAPPPPTDAPGGGHLDGPSPPPLAVSRVGLAPCEDAGWRATRAHPSPPWDPLCGRGRLVGADKRKEKNRKKRQHRKPAHTRPPGRVLAPARHTRCWWTSRLACFCKSSLHPPPHATYGRAPASEAPAEPPRRAPMEGQLAERRWSGAAENAAPPPSSCVRPGPRVGPQSLAGRSRAPSEGALWRAAPSSRPPQRSPRLPHPARRVHHE